MPKADRKLLFSVTMKDLDMQTFTVPGHGGGGKDTSRNGVRLVHKSSGAVGEGRECRSLTLNRKAAFLRLVNSAAFQRWHKAECARRMGQPIPLTEEEIRAIVDQRVDDDLRDGRIVIEEFPC